MTHARLTGGSAVLMASDMPVERTVPEGETSAFQWSVMGLRKKNGHFELSASAGG